MAYYKPTPLFSSKFVYRYRMRGIFVYKPTTYYKPTPCSELMYGRSPMGL